MRSGVDIVKISRLEKMVARHEKSLGRFFTAGELAYCHHLDGTWSLDSLAAIFAAKEALYKALGTGFITGSWRDVEICHDDLGAPYYQLHGVYRQLVAAKASQQPVLSLAHDGDYAIAMVVM